MKAKMLATAILCLSILPLTSFADETDCDKNSIACNYVTGLHEDDLSDGRYLKIENQHEAQKSTIIMCFNNTLVMEVKKSEASDLVGNLQTIVSICTDQSGNHCELVKDFSTQITKLNDTTYVANPARMQIDLAPYATKYTRCDATQSREVSKMFKQS